MRSKKISISPGMLLALVVVFVLGLASAATAGSLINGSKIKKGTIGYSALSKDAKKQLAKSSKSGPQGPQGQPGSPGAAAPTYWAMINQDGGVARSSAGVSSTHSLNSTYWQYRVSFPRDVGSCGYSTTTSDPNVIGANEFTQPTWVSASRSNAGGNVVAVNVWNLAGNSIEDSFFLAVYC
jgi:hypothetical protein